MSVQERKTERALPTRKSLEDSLPDDPAQLRQLAAQLLVEKLSLKASLTPKKDVSAIPGQLSNQHKTMVVDALRSSFHLPALLQAVRLSTSSYYYQRKVMAQECIHVRRSGKKWQYSSYQGEVSPVPDNLVQRHFHAPLRTCCG